MSEPRASATSAFGSTALPLGLITLLALALRIVETARIDHDPLSAHLHDGRLELGERRQPARGEIFSRERDFPGEG